MRMRLVGHAVTGNSHRVIFDLDWFVLGVETKATIWMRLSSGRHAGRDGMCCLRDAPQVIYWLPPGVRFRRTLRPRKSYGGRRSCLRRQ